MQIGVVFPQTEIGGDRGAVRAYASAVEGAGYSHILAYDHVLGADWSRHPDRPGPYDQDSTFHEPLVLFGFLAGVCALELVTGIVILPQRQTALVAKQAAEVDLLTGGRFRLGVGLGWNPVEYEALGMSFSNRGRRIEEQITLLRRLWTEPVLDFEGREHRVSAAGIAPLPIQRPIPVWMGAFSKPALIRLGRLADGWLATAPPGHGLEEGLDHVRRGAEEAGRDPAAIGLEGRADARPGQLDRVVEHVGRWRAAGATHLSVNTMGGGLAAVDDHIAALVELAPALGLEGGGAGQR
ncbi:MAG TPA: LLM class F420-dependent oxidoreductase [Acidimicrobiales bacterium]|nr:LLM class F420-dependent oxidoreductase [Acidimicrobiales bacterium]